MTGQERLWLVLLAGVLAASGAITVTAIVAPEPVPAVPVLPATLPACDDSGPERQITGPCWLADDDQTAIWPYPYASEPVTVLQRS